MSEPAQSSASQVIPTFLYGTAWKEERTEALTELALLHGFRGIDTANQRKHYDEAGVGRGLQRVFAAGKITRDDVFLQTKFTFQAGQDHRLPYDPTAPIATQVEQSFARSLEHLGVRHLDSYVLHGPSRRIGLGPDDWAAWRRMEELQVNGGVKWLGISNVSLEQLEALCREAEVPPRFVQNRCYAVRDWDRSIREFCTARAIVYQGFSLLTANREFLAHAELLRIAERYRRTPAQIVFRFALDVGMLPLTGTTDPEHMDADLAIHDFRLEATEVERIEWIARR